MKFPALPVAMRRELIHAMRNAGPGEVIVASPTDMTFLFRDPALPRPDTRPAPAGWDSLENVR